MARPPIIRTQGDPASYRPHAELEGLAGEPVGLRASHAARRARAIALEVAEAVRSGDRDALSELLAGPLARALPRTSAALNPASGVLNVAMDPRRRQQLGAPPPLGELLDLEHVQVGTLGERLGSRPVPAGLRADDLFVVLPLQTAGRSFFMRLLPGWRLIGGVIVRPGVVPRVVGL